ncbi:MAG: RDD family protein [Bradyrhizobium sp.]|nr:RDD family protein [Bradyrhizobium sp.]
MLIIGLAVGILGAKLALVGGTLYFALMGVVMVIAAVLIFRNRRGGILLYAVAFIASVIWAIVYYGATIGGPNSATIGMRIMDLELRTWYGAPGYFVLGAVHAVCFWISVSVLSPFVLLVGLFNGRRRLLHDFVLGTVVINTSVRAQLAQPARTW